MPGIGENGIGLKGIGRGGIGSPTGSTPQPSPLIHYPMDATDKTDVIFGTGWNVSGASAPDTLALRFDGNSKMDKSADVAAVNAIGTKDFSISFWIRTTTFDTDTIVHFGESNTTAGFKLSMLNNGKLRFTLGGGNRTADNINITTGQWHYCVIQISSSGVDFYVDTVLIDSEAPYASWDINGATEFSIGANHTNTFRVMGDIDDFRIYDILLTADNMTYLHNNTNIWTPEELDDTDKYFWIDPSNLTTITSALGAVSQIDDLSNKGVDFIQPTAGLEPITDSENINAFNALDETNFVWMYNFTDGSLPDSGNFTYFAVNDMRDSQISQESMIEFTLASGDTLWRVDNSNVTPDFTARHRDILNDEFIVGGDFRNAPHIFENVFDFDNNNEFRYIDGEQNGTPITGGYTQKISGSVYIRWGVTIGLTRKSRGIYGEHLLIESNDTSTRQFVQGYLAWKWWGDQNILDVSHPYKSAPPQT